MQQKIVHFLRESNGFRTGNDRFVGEISFYYRKIFELSIVLKIVLKGFYYKFQGESN